MFCLETVKSNEVVLNPIGCNCKYMSHGPCLQSWFQEKNQYECPICHAVSIPNPIQSPQPMYQIVYIQERREEIERRMTRSQKKCAAILCFTIICWGIIMNIIEAVLRR